MSFLTGELNNLSQFHTQSDFVVSIGTEDAFFLTVAELRPEGNHMTSQNQKSPLTNGAGKPVSSDTRAAFLFP